jgi:hypothetical protein
VVAGRCIDTPARSVPTDRHRWQRVVRSNARPPYEAHIPGMLTGRGLRMITLQRSSDLRRSHMPFGLRDAQKRSLLSSLT